MKDKIANWVNGSLLNNRLFKNSLYTGVALSFVGLVPFVFNILIARTFGKEVLGSINVTLSFCLMITIFVTNFFGTGGNKFLAEYRGRKSLEPFIFILKILFIGPIVILTIINGIITWKWTFLVNQFSLQSEMLIPIITYVYFRSFYILGRRMYYGMDIVKSYAIIEIVSDIILIGAIVLVSWFNLPHLLIQCYVIGYATFTLLSGIVLLKKFESITKSLSPIGHSEMKPVLKKYIKYGFVSMTGTTASTGTGYLSMVFTGYYLTTADAGLYASVLTIVSILMFLPRLVTQVLLPEFSKLFGEGNLKSIIHTLKKSIWLLVAIAFVTNLVLFLFAEEILSIFGASFVKGSSILKIIIPSIFIRMISVPLVTFLSGTSFVVYPNIGGVIIFVTSIFSWLILVPDFQLVGIALGYVIGIIVGIGYQIIMAFIKMNAFQTTH